VLGRVPLVVPQIAPAPSAPGPWWLRAAAAVGGAIGDAIGALSG
jgi:hypothetical protein